MSGCVCGHPKREHDSDGMCKVDHLLCGCCDYCSTDLGDYPPMPRNYEQCAECGGDRTLQHHCDLVAEVRKLRERIALMRDLHRPTGVLGVVRCRECRNDWPCDTAWKLDGLDEANHA